MAGRRERAVWGTEEEDVLLQLFLDARADPELRSERGVRGHGWQRMAADLNARCQRSFDKDQLKSKYVRIMQEFDLYQSVAQFLGPIKSAADEKAWEKLLNDRPKNAPQLRQFRENGFVHAAMCKRIAADLATTPSDAASAPAKRSRADPEAADSVTAKKPRQSVDGRRERAVWGLAEEKLLLFLYLRAKNDSELRSDKGIKSRGWQSVVDDLNKHSGKEFDKDQCKSKYQRLMQEFELYKSVTGYPATRVLAGKEWDRLIEQRQRFAPQLRVLKERGFPHAETCALITGEATESVKQAANVNELIASESLQLSGSGNNGNTANRTAAPTPSVPLPAPLALAANVLPFLLPAAGNVATPSLPTGNRRVADSSSNGTTDSASASAAAAAATAAVTSQFFTTELRDNLNQFLKTATAYMVMQLNKQN